MSPTSDDGHTGRSPRKGARIGPVSELSVFLKVKPGREQLIREVEIIPLEIVVRNIAAGSISQGMTDRSTNRMPVRAARSSNRGRLPLGRGGCGGRSGAIAAQRSSGRSGRAIPPQRPTEPIVPFC